MAKKSKVKKRRAKRSLPGYLGHIYPKRKSTSPPVPSSGAKPLSNTSSLDAGNKVAVRRRYPREAVTSQSQGIQGVAATGEAGSLVVETADATDATDATVTPGAYTLMLRRVSAVEATLEEIQEKIAKLSRPEPGIGHNNPPPITPEELEDIKNEIARLKSDPPPRPTEANQAARKFARWGWRVLEWIGNHVDTLIDAAMKKAGATLGLSPLWLPFSQQLTDAATAIIQWVITLPGVGQ